MIKKPTLSIIIPCFNAQKYIKNCLDSILKSNFSNFEVIVVDDGSTDESKEFLRNLRMWKYRDTDKKKRGKNNFSKFLNFYKASAGERSISLKVVFNKENLGAATARNIGVKKSLGRYLLFLDADTEVEKETLKTFLAAFKRYPKVGAIQAKLLLGKTGKIDTIGHFLSPFGFPYEVGHNRPEKKYQKKQPIFAGRTAALAVRRNIFKKIGGFDEDYLIYGEDTDLCWRIWLAGYQVIILPQARVYHYSKSSLEQKTYRRVFFEGAKNHTSNILKNANLRKLFWLLPLHLLAWAILAIKLILDGRNKDALAIFRGLWWNLIHLPKTVKKRKKIAHFRKKNSQAEKYLLGEIKLRKLLSAGWQWLKNV